MDSCFCCWKDGKRYKSELVSTNPQFLSDMPTGSHCHMTEILAPCPIAQAAFYVCCQHKHRQSPSDAPKHMQTVQLQDRAKAEEELFTRCFCSHVHQKQKLLFFFNNKSLPVHLSTEVLQLDFYLPKSSAEQLSVPPSVLFLSVPSHSQAISLKCHS